MKPRLLSTARLSLPLALVISTLVFTHSSHAADGSWTGTTSGAWLTATNWTSSVIPGSPGTTTNTDIATFSAAAQPTVGLNFDTTGGTYYLGAIDYNNATARNIGNSSSTTPGILTLNGATVNGVANTVLRNNTTTPITFQAAQAGGGTMGLALGNATNNVIQTTNTGNILISSIISGVGSNLTFQGGGTGTLLLSGANTYSGTTTINSRTISISGATGAIAGTTGITLNGGSFSMTNVAAEVAANRVNNAAAITSNGGSITLANTSANSVAYAEMLGAVALTSGQLNLIENTNQVGTGTSSQTLTLAGLTRTGATNTSAVTFSAATTGSQLSGSKNMIVVTGGGSTAAEEIIAPWATVGTTAALQTDYATYTSDYVTGRGTAATTDDSTWSTTTAATSNYNFANGTTGTTLTDTRNINTLRHTGGVETLALSSFNLGTLGILNGVASTLTITGTGAVTLPTTTSDYLYVTTGSGPIAISAPINDNGAGVLTLVKSGSGTLTLTGANNYTGGTSVNAGTLQLGAGTADGSMNTSSAISVAANSVFAVNQSDTVTQGTDFSGAAITGAGGFTQAGTGTTVLNAANTYTGNTTVTGGTLNITVAYTGNTTTTALAYGTTAANTVVNVSNNLTLFNITGAAISGSNAVYNQTAGTVTTSQTAAFTQAASTLAGGYGYFNLTGGSYTTGSGNFSVQVDGNAAAYVGGTGVLNLNATSNNTIGFRAGVGSLTVGPGGTVNRSNGAGAMFLMTNQNSTGILNIAGGDINLGTGGFRAGNGNTVAFTGMNGFVNLAGGTLTMGAVTANNSNSSNNLYANYAGGTLKTSANLTNPFTTANGVTTVSTIFGAITNNNNANAAFNTQIGTTSNFTGGLTVDTNGFAVTYGNALRGAASNGVKQANITVTGGSGYIGAPLVTFTGGTLATNGVPASGYAVISGGTVTGIVITSPGTYTADPTVTLTGGGGTGASVSLSALTANSTDGGLTKTGSGTLTLSGANTYVGPTAVNGGTLAVTGSLGATTVTVNSPATLGGNGNIGGNVTITSGAHHALAVAATAGAQVTRAITGTLTLTSGNILDLTAAAPPAPGEYVLATATTAITGTPTTINYTGLSGTVSVDTVSSPNRLLLTVAAPGGYASWASTNAIGSNPDQDKDNDGVNNATEYVLGGTVLTNDLSKLPELSTSGGNLLFTFDRDQDSIDGSTVVTIEVGTTLATWPDNYSVPGPAQTNVPGVSIDKDTSVGFDTVTLSVPQAPDAKKFARLKVVVAP